MVGVFGDGLFSSHDHVQVWVRGSDILLADFSEYGLYAAESLRQQRATPIDTMEFGAALEWAARSLAENDQVVTWWGTGYTPGYEFGGDFSRARVIPGHRQQVGIAEILEVIQGDKQDEA